METKEIRSNWTLRPYPNYGGMGGGSAMEMQAQRKWEREIGNCALEWAIKASQIVPKLLNANESQAKAIVVLRALMEPELSNEEVEAEFDKYSPEEKAKFDALNQRCLDRARGHPDGPRLCIICAYEKPYGVFDSVTGACVCVECRDKARR